MWQGIFSCFVAVNEKGFLEHKNLGTARKLANAHCLLESLSHLLKKLGKPLQIDVLSLWSYSRTTKSLSFVLSLGRTTKLGMQKGLQEKRSSAKRFRPDKSFSQKLATKCSEGGASGVPDKKSKKTKNLPNKFLFLLDCA